jgi:putative transposase
VLCAAAHNTYVKTWTGWAFLATVIDCYSRKVVGFALADPMRTDLITDALRMAIVARNPPPGVIFHSDRGAQYTSDEFRSFCGNNGVRPSVGRTGSCFDNAVAESFFATIKKELIHTRPWPTLDKLRGAVFEYIESYYNRRRRHSTIGYDTPIEYEKKYALTRLQAV